MPLVRLIYVSTLSKECDPAALQDILDKSHEHNKESKITGLLSHNEDYFMQCLEGSREAVNNTYNYIVND